MVGQYVLPNIKLYDTGRNREMLHDMNTDRGEMRNLAIEKQYREIVLQHRQLLRQWMKEHPSPKQSYLKCIPND